MSEHLATVIWRRNDQTFVDSRFSREHLWKFDGGAEVKASPSPHVVPSPFSVEENVDPEEAFVASLSSCHMLFFLHFAARGKFVVDEYLDNAIGVMGKNAEGKMAMLRVRLRPIVTFSGDGAPDEDQIRQLHRRSHEECFIANSVKTEVTVEMQRC